MIICTQTHWHLTLCRCVSMFGVMVVDIRNGLSNPSLNSGWGSSYFNSDYG